MNIIDGLQARFSTRAFLSKSVDIGQIEKILDAARWTPSGKNTQPWHVAVVQGKTKHKISAALLQAYRNGEPARADYHYYSEHTPAEFRDRAFKCGMALYGALGIERGDKARRKAVWEENYNFFGAPVGLLIFLDAPLEKGSWVDAGMFLQSIMLAAVDLNLATCPQAALAEYPDLVKQILGEPFTNKNLVCGISLGYADKDHPVNRYRTEREAVNDFTQWYE